MATHKVALRKAFGAKEAKRRNGAVAVDVEPFGNNPNDGTFLMSFYDFREFFTHIFAVVDFPDEWSSAQATGTWKVRACSRKQCHFSFLCVFDHIAMRVMCTIVLCPGVCRGTIYPPGWHHRGRDSLRRRLTGPQAVEPHSPEDVALWLGAR